MILFSLFMLSSLLMWHASQKIWWNLFKQNEILLNNKTVYSNFIALFSVLWLGLQSGAICIELYPLHLNSHLLPIFISYRSGWGEVDKISSKINSSCLIMSLIFRTTLFYKALILHREIWCWSLLGLNGLKGLCHGWLIHFIYRCQLCVIFTMKLDKLLLNGKIIALLYQTNMPPKHNIKHYKQRKWT